MLGMDGERQARGSGALGRKTLREGYVGVGRGFELREVDAFLGGVGQHDRAGSEEERPTPVTDPKRVSLVRLARCTQTTSRPSRSARGSPSASLGPREFEAGFTRRSRPGPGPALQSNRLGPRRRRVRPRVLPASLPRLWAGRGERLSHLSAAGPQKDCALGSSRLVLRPGQGGVGGAVRAQVWLLAGSGGRGSGALSRLRVRCRRCPAEFLVVCLAAEARCTS
jgi:hypothetical protein